MDSISRRRFLERAVPPENRDKVPMTGTLVRRTLTAFDAAWLSLADQQHAPTPRLAEFRARGGAIEYA